jgi:hypothetical protein
MARILCLRPLVTMTADEARSLLCDLDRAMATDPATRQLAWRVLNACRRGQPAPVLVLCAGIEWPAPQPPKDAA